MAAVSHPLQTRSNRAESGPTPQKWKKEQKPSFLALRKPVPLSFTFSREGTNSATAPGSGRVQHHAFHTTLSLETYHPMHATALCSSTRGNIAHAHETWVETKGQQRHPGIFFHVRNKGSLLYTIWDTTGRPLTAKAGTTGSRKAHHGCGVVSLPTRGEGVCGAPHEKRKHHFYPGSQLVTPPYHIHLLIFVFRFLQVFADIGGCTRHECSQCS